MSLLQEFEQLIERIQNNPEPIRQLEAVYEFRLDAGKVWQIRFHQGAASLSESALHPADCRIIATEATLRKLLNGKLNPTSAYIAGELKLEGKLRAGFRLQEVLKAYQIGG